ncbi:hypothetical protein N7492_002552 [Penicillium capsulatum]|uniref:Nucleolar protein Dnt1-like N-terminal domain-containing protein n=1 Tax=Penicillium capsulatum TaxID=69766 RepID=A0A9W9IKA6_9EURO|nr:hypothetical protein N7492_002552 [Penicillium capsulatum]KAJ6122844.1 hypothetical protein N7512_005309 [Penicillium capsulatum]
MVFLRLEVKVLRDAPAFGLVRSIEPRENQPQNDGESLQPSSTSFLLLLDKPEEVTLGELASLILEEWKSLRPNQPPLQIKKLVDDSCPSVDLRLASTVADIFVNRGKAEADGHDQRGTVRVIQKPSAEVPERFPSVVQDWDGAIQDAHRRKSKKQVTRFSPIHEDDELLNGWKSSPVPHEYDIAGKGDDVGSTGPSTAAIADTPPCTRIGSEELGDSPSPAARRPTPHPPFGPGLFRRASIGSTNASNKHVTASAAEPASHKRKRRSEKGPFGNPARRGSSTSERISPASPAVGHKPAVPSVTDHDVSRKRKHTPEQDQPKKQARTGTNGSAHKSPTYPPGSPSRRRVSAFSSPRRRVSISDESRHTPEHGLGLGITQSPKHSRQGIDDLTSSQEPIKAPLFRNTATASSAQTSEKPRLPSSALKKDSNPASSRPHKRHSVSFAESEDNSPEITSNATSAHQKPQVAPPSSQMSEIVWPPGFSQEQIEQFYKQAEEKVSGTTGKPGELRSATRLREKPKAPTNKPQPAPAPSKKTGRLQPTNKHEEILKEISEATRRYEDARTSKRSKKRIVSRIRQLQDDLRGLGTSNPLKTADNRERLSAETDRTQEQIGDSQNRKQKRQSVNNRLQKGDANLTKLEPPLPVIETTVTRQIPSNENPRTVNMSNPSMNGGIDTRHQSVSSASSRQSGIPTDRENSRSLNQPQRVLTNHTHSSTPASRFPDTSRSRSGSLVKQAPPMSPSIKEEEESDSEDSINLQRASESAMDLDEDDEHKGDEDAPAKSGLRSDSGQTQSEDEESHTSESEAQHEQAQSNEVETVNSSPAKNSHTGDSETASESEDDQDDEGDLPKEDQGTMVNGSQEHPNNQAPEKTDNASESGETSGSEDEHSEKNTSVEVQEQPTGGDADVDAPMPDAIDDASDSGEPSESEDEDPPEESIGTEVQQQPTGDNTQTNAQVPGITNDASHSGESSESEDEDSTEESSELEIQNQPSDDQEKTDGQQLDSINDTGDSGEFGASKDKQHTDDRIRVEVQTNSPADQGITDGMPATPKDRGDSGKPNASEEAGNIEVNLEKEAQDHSDHGHQNQANGELSQSQVNGQAQLNGQTSAKPSESDTDSSDSSDSDDDSDGLTSLSLAKRGSLTPKPSATPISSMPVNSQPPVSTKMPVLQRTTLKGLLKAQREESKRREQQNNPTGPQRSSGTKQDIYEVPSSRESQTSSDEESEGGDIPYNGILSKLRSSWSGRH